MVCHFFTLMVLARLLDPETNGVYFIALMMTFLLKLLSDFGVDLAFVKQYPEESEQGKSALLRSAVALRILFCVLISALYVGIEELGVIPLLNDIGHVTALTLALYWLHSLRELILRLLQAEQIFAVYAGTQVLAAVLKSVLMLGLFLIVDVGVGHVLAVEVIAFIASILYACYRLRDRLRAAWASRMNGGRQLLSFGYPLYLNALLNLGNEKVSNFIVAGFGGPIAMVFFGYAERLADAGTRLFEAFANVYLPAQTNHFARTDEPAARELANRSMLWIAFVISAGMVTFAIIREPFIVLFFTEKYVSVADGALMFFAVLMLRSLQTLMGYFGVAGGHKFLPVKVSMVSSVFNIAACLWMFQRYGYVGVIAALVATQALMNALYYYWLKKAGSQFEIRPVITLLTGCCLAIAWVYHFDDSLPLAALALPLFLIGCYLILPGLRSDTATGIALLKERFNP